jgi:hypothetical protein
VLGSVIDPQKKLLPVYSRIVAVVSSINHVELVAQSRCTYWWHVVQLEDWIDTICLLAWYSAFLAWLQANQPVKVVAQTFSKISGRDFPATNEYVLGLTNGVVVTAHKDIPDAMEMKTITKQL